MHDEAHIVDSDRGLGHVGREHDLGRATGLRRPVEDTPLLVGRQRAVQRQYPLPLQTIGHLRPSEQRRAHRFDLGGAGQEDEHRT